MCLQTVSFPVERQTGDWHSSTNLNDLLSKEGCDIIYDLRVLHSGDFEPVDLRIGGLVVCNFVRNSTSSCWIPEHGAFSTRDVALYAKLVKWHGIQLVVKFNRNVTAVDVSLSYKSDMFITGEENLLNRNTVFHVFNLKPFLTESSLTYYDGLFGLDQPCLYHENQVVQSTTNLLQLEEDLVTQYAGFTLHQVSNFDLVCNISFTTTLPIGKAALFLGLQKVGDFESVDKTHYHYTGFTRLNPFYVCLSKEPLRIGIQSQSNDSDVRKIRVSYNVTQLCATTKYFMLQRSNDRGLVTPTAVPHQYVQYYKDNVIVHNFIQQ